ncbi:hypothetical protein H0R92_02375 [Treponema sp. OMZ 840]|uniref:hypothetical protein n=1 Tax=Treponema sp. OMZ 840 TaxID=244313 RepID=UPI003D906216
MNKSNKKAAILILCFSFILFGNVLYAEDKNMSLSETMIIGKEEYALPCALDTFLKNGWKISEKRFYMHPLHNKDWYEVRYTLSCKENGAKLIPWGTAIRTLEKNGSFLEVEIENRSKKIAAVEDSTVQAILVLRTYIKEDVKLKNGLSLQNFKMEELWKNGEQQKYPFSEGWQLSQTDYIKESGFFEEEFYKITEHKKQSVTFYYDKKMSLLGLELRNEVDGNKLR